jgi:hypothetical protein
MATLNSPGVQVNVIDESFYTPSAPGTVPMFFVASAQDKTNPSGTTALGTTAANAGKVWLITSQRDLTDTFGTPLFYTDSSGNALHGNELNEYGLQAAYSSLGVSSRAYIVRTDLDLGALTPTSSEPDGSPVSGTYWVDTASSVYGVKEWNSSTQAFTVKTPIVLDDSSSSYLVSEVPSTAVGQQGSYAMVVTKNNANTLYYKKANNSWVAVADNFESGKRVRVSPHYTYPSYDGSTATGSVWVTTTTPSNGANWIVKKYDSASASWTTVTAPIYDTIPAAQYALDPTGGGKNIATGSLFIDSNASNTSTVSANFVVWRKSASGSTTITSGANSELVNTASSYTFTIRETTSTSSWGTTKTVSFSSTNTTVKLGSLVPAAVSAEGLTYVTASWNDATNILTMTMGSSQQRLQQTCILLLATTD